MTVIKSLLVSDRTIISGQGISLHYNSQDKAVIDFLILTKSFDVFNLT